MLIKLLEMLNVVFAALNEIGLGSFSNSVSFDIRIHDSFKSNIKLIIVIRLMHLAVTSIIV